MELSIQMMQIVLMLILGQIIVPMKSMIIILMKTKLTVN